MTLTGSLTHSGIEITRDTGVPSLDDLGLALSRTARFNGHTRKFWSVLDHSLFVERLARELPFGHVNNIRQRALRLAALLHDAHEAVTSDISTHFKTVSMRVVQAQLDVRIMEAYMPGGINAYLALTPDVKSLDRRALLAEALVLHPAISAGNVSHYFGDVPEPRDVRLLRKLVRQGPVDPIVFGGLYTELITSHP